MAEKDLPAFIEKIRNVTEVPKITFIGFSQGTSEILYALAEPELQPYF